MKKKETTNPVKETIETEQVRYVASQWIIDTIEIKQKSIKFAVSVLRTRQSKIYVQTIDHELSTHIVDAENQNEAIGIALKRIKDETEGNKDKVGFAVLMYQVTFICINENKKL